MADGVANGFSEWHAVLAEVIHQTSEKRGGKDTESVWYDLAEDASTSASDKQASPRWHQQNWAKAFTILVRALPSHRAQAGQGREPKSVCLAAVLPSTSMYSAERTAG